MIAKKLVHDFGVVLTKIGYLIVHVGARIHAYGTNLRLTSTAPWLVSIEQRLEISYTATDANGNVFGGNGGGCKCGDCGPSGPLGSPGCGGGK